MKYIGLAIITALIGILLHEMDHYIVAIAMGLNPQLHATYITIEGTSEFSLLDSRIALTILGGVGASLSFLILAIFANRGQKQHSTLYFIAGQYPVCIYCYFLILTYIATSTAIGYPIPSFEHNATDEFKLSIITSYLIVGEQNNNIIVTCLTFFIATPLILFHILQCLTCKHRTKKESILMFNSLITGSLLGSLIWIYFFKF